MEFCRHQKHTYVEDGRRHVKAIDIINFSNHKYMFYIKVLSKIFLFTVSQSINHLYISLQNSRSNAAGYHLVTVVITSKTQIKEKVLESKTLGYLPRVLFFNAFELGAVI
jgi:hypothetical protein